MNNSKSLNEVLILAVSMARELHHEYITPEHMLFALLHQKYFLNKLACFNVDSSWMKGELYEWLKHMEQVPERKEIPVPSVQFLDAMKISANLSMCENSEIVDVREYVEAILSLEDSFAAYVLGSALEGEEDEFLDSIQEDDMESEPNFGNYEERPRKAETHKDDWHRLVTDISERAKDHTPLIGRETELDRTVQVLCRMEKNNPLHIGDPGVGKTAIIYGLAKMINSDNVPDRLRGRKIYGVDVSQLLAGAQYRGDFEKRMNMVMEGAAKEHAILYLDEIHNMVGAGRGGEGGPDASNIMKPYLQTGDVSFIGATTHEDYRKSICKDKAIVRRFQSIDIKEPSIDETIRILKGLQPSLQKFHKVIYRKEAIEYAARAGAKYIVDRRLPDKAIDLLDEAGAYLETHPEVARSRAYVTKSMIEDVLMKTCRIQANALKEKENSSLASLKDNILDRIYGQDKAVEELTQVVMMAKAGLAEEDKPLASLLFVGPTGVGKTEVARVLALELGVELVRFDMSEYTEKHTVAKLIGSPAGYVGYEDGGLLTAAIQKTPNCVLLLDEIEKAHDDIYNILLQVMDYARLTDSKGQKADFRNVILIMTSNAGAQYASRASVGFGGGVSRGEAMRMQVKKTFKPEFINRLNDIVVFNDMDLKMASLILRKKLETLKAKLAVKGVKPVFTDNAFDAMLKKGFTKEYGAREIDRVITQDVKPLFVKEILFGKLRKGGNVAVDYADGIFCLDYKCANA